HGRVAAANITGTVPLAAPGGPLSAVFDTQLTWPKGQRLRVRFLDRFPDFTDQVQHYVKGWEEAANVQFDFVTAGDAQTRITFAMTGVFYSYIGKEVFSQPP